MAKFRKKPVVIEAILWDGFLQSLTAAPWISWRMHADHPERISCEAAGEPAFITTLEGVMRADVGDWIIQGVKGEIYRAPVCALPQVLLPLRQGLSPSVHDNPAGVLSGMRSSVCQEAPSIQGEAGEGADEGEEEGDSQAE
jgi:hypothetical protein